MRTVEHRWNRRLAHAGLAGIALLLVVFARTLASQPGEAPSPAVVQAGERLRISVVGLMSPGVETRVTRLVEADGNLRLPKLQGRAVDARGKGAAALEEAILRAYRDQVVLPQPTMVVVSRLDAGEDHALEAWRAPPEPVRHAGLVVRGMVAPWPDALTRPLDGPIEVDQVPLEDVLALLSQRMGVRISVNWVTLAMVGVDRDTPVTLQADGAVPAARVLRMVLDHASPMEPLAYEWIDGLLMISTDEELGVHVQTSVIDLGPLLDGFEPGDRDVIVGDIVALITETISTDAWRVNGGDLCSIDEIDGRLAITATPRMHREIIALLEKLAR
jgi:hypothetical protein